jgi:hypothetical protein
MDGRSFDFSHGTVSAAIKSCGFFFGKPRSNDFFPEGHFYTGSKDAWLFQNGKRDYFFLSFACAPRGFTCIEYRGK